MDPLTAPALGLGAASLAIQVFDGVKSGYHYFEAAVQMPVDCESFKLRLRIEYTRLLDWGDLAGLTDESKHKQFDTRLKANRAIIMALLSEIQSRQAQAAWNVPQPRKHSFSTRNPLQSQEPVFERTQKKFFNRETLAKNKSVCSSHLMLPIARRSMRKGLTTSST